MCGFGTGWGDGVMYSTLKIAALCAHLFAVQQERLDDYNHFAMYSSETPMAVVVLSPIAASARRAQHIYERTCIDR